MVSLILVTEIRLVARIRETIERVYRERMGKKSG
jgi:hypothetical protein